MSPRLPVSDVLHDVPTREVLAVCEITRLEHCCRGDPCALQSLCGEILVHVRSPAADHIINLMSVPPASLQGPEPVEGGRISAGQRPQSREFFVAERGDRHPLVVTAGAICAMRYRVLPVVSLRDGLF